MRRALEDVSVERTDLDLDWAGLAECRQALPICRLADGSEHVGTSWTAQERAEGWHLESAAGPIQFELDVARHGRVAELTLGAVALELAVVVEMGLRTRPTIGGRPPTRVLYNAYHSWDPSGQLRLEPGTSIPGGVVESWWTCGLADESSAALAVSALAASEVAFRCRLDGERWDLLWCEPPIDTTAQPVWSAKPGDRWEGGGIRLTASEELASALETAADAGRPRAPTSVPRGWLSWYHYGPWVTAEDVLENASMLSKLGMDELGYRLIQIDDGWQEAYGDWTPNRKFPGGLRSIVEAAGGHMVGVWTAPFLVNSDSRLARQAPDEWFMRDANGAGRLVDSRHVLMGPMHILNLRLDAVRSHLTETFARLRSDGITYFKIDFLYAGGFSGTAALRSAVAAIREGVGDDSYLLACGAPLLPMVGLVDGCRVGTDTATPFYDFELAAAKPTVFGDEVNSVGRNLAARSLLRSWFQLDADVALVGGNLSLGQARQVVTLAALSGGPFFASDRLSELSPERRALLTNREVMALAGGQVALPDWGSAAEDEPPALWSLDGAMAVFNWSDAEREIAVPAPAGTRVRDLWAGSDMGVWEPRGTVAVGPHDVRLLAFNR